MITIEKNVPVPPKGTPGARSKYPWREMKVGDSFFVLKNTREFSSHVQNAKRRTGFNFTVRTEKNGTRVWRLK